LNARVVATIAVVALAVAIASLEGSTPALEGRVVRVPDGDSLEVVMEGERRRIRIFGIDAPELGQPWSRRAREALAARVADRTVRVHTVERDAYDRTVAEIYAGDVCVACELVRAGHAWVYRRYDPDPSLLALEDEARASGRGLWGLPASERTPPWEWRRENRRARQGSRSR
jgi:endonuclease YncB( thermonuclease family)